MNDPYGRPTRSIRISVNNNCNLDCYYCHNEGQAKSNIVMSPEQIEKILFLAKRLDITKVKFTGGEPLLRNDIADIIYRASKYMDDVSITTNGTLLSPIANDLKKSGLNRVNVSLDSINPEKYKKITGKNLLDKALNGIKAAVKAEIHPVKVNIVALSDMNIEDIMKIVKKVWSMKGIPQIIELVDINDKNYLDISQIEKYIISKAVNVKERSMHKRKIYDLIDDDGNVKNVEIVRPTHNTEFCANCSRIRVTSNGFLKPCLMHNNGLVDILTSIRNEEDDETQLKLFKSAIMNRAPCWS